MEIHIFISGQFIVQAWVLENNPNRFSDIILFIKTISIDGYLTACRMENRCQNLYRRGFPCSIGSEKCENLSFLDLERDIIYSSDSVIEGFDQMFDINDHYTKKTYKTHYKGYYFLLEDFSEPILVCNLSINSLTLAALTKPRKHFHLLVTSNLSPAFMPRCCLASIGMIICHLVFTVTLP